MNEWREGGNGQCLPSGLGVSLSQPPIDWQAAVSFQTLSIPTGPQRCQGGRTAPAGIGDRETEPGRAPAVLLFFFLSLLLVLLFGPDDRALGEHDCAIGLPHILRLLFSSLHLHGPSLRFPRRFLRLQRSH